MHRPWFPVQRIRVIQSRRRAAQSMAVIGRYFLTRAQARRARQVACKALVTEARPWSALVLGLSAASETRPLCGALDWGSPCHMSNLRNVNVPCHLNGHVPCRLSDQDCRLSNLRNTPCRIPYVVSHVSRLNVAFRF